MIPWRASRAATDKVARRAAGDRERVRRRCRSTVAALLHCPDRHHRHPSPPPRWGRQRSHQSRGMCDCGWRGQVRWPTGTSTSLTSSSSSSYVNAVQRRRGNIVLRQPQQPRRQHQRALHNFARSLCDRDSRFRAGNVTFVGPVRMAAARRSSWNCVTDVVTGYEGQRFISSPSVVVAAAAASDGPITRSCLAPVDRDGDDPDSHPHDDHGDRNVSRRRNRKKERSLDTGFHVAFLGTGGSVPSRHRNTSCTALRLGGHTLLFDVGEGLQRQLALSTLSVLEIKRIYVTHLHGDHLFGLPGLLLQIGVTHKHRSDMRRVAAAAAGTDDVDVVEKKSEDGDDEDEETIELYGPPGLYNYVAMTMTLSCARFPRRLRLVVHELTGGAEEAGPRPPGSWTANRGGGDPKKNPFLDAYPEFASSVPNVTRVLVPMDEDGTWTLATPSRPTIKEIKEVGERREDKRRVRMLRKSRENRGRNDDGDDALLHRSERRLPGSFRRGEQVHVKAAELIHQPGVPTFGYVVTEVEPPPPIDPKRAEVLGVRPGPKYMLLKHGYPVERDDDGDDEGDNDRGLTRSRGLVRPEQVLLPPKHLPRKFALLGDHCVVPEPMSMLCEGADVLVHEAAGTKREASEALRRGHATASMAGRMADEVNAKVLVLNHFRGGMQGRESIEETVEEAEDAMKDEGGRSTSNKLVIAAHDFMELLVPRGGV